MNRIEQKEELRKNIFEMKSGSIEQMLLIVKYSLTAYFKSAITFGSDNRVTRDNILIIKEMFEILRRERKLLNYILRNIDYFDVTSSEEVVGMLDEVNDKTIDYYYGLLNDIEDAAELGQEFRGYRPRKGASTLITDDKYLLEVVGLGLSLDDLKAYLGYEDDFWNFVKDRIKLINTSSDIMEQMARVTPITNNGEIVDIDMLIPRIIDLRSATVALEMYEKAYNFYKLLGSRVEDYDKTDAESTKKRYVEEYLPQQAKELFKIKNVN